MASWVMADTDSVPPSQLNPCVPADLVPHIITWGGFEELQATPFIHLMPAGTFLPLIINFADPYQIHAGHRPGESGSHDTFVAGLIDRFTVVRSAGPVHCMQVDFTPFGARAFFHLPLNEIAGQVVSLHDLLGRAGRDLVAQLAVRGTWPDRFALLARFIRHRIAAGPQPSATVRLAMRQIIETGGQARIGLLASNLDVSREHLARRFAADVGISPKAFARIIRFQHAAAHLSRNGISTAEIAFDTGYADQAHMTREVRRMTGVTPGAL